MLPIHDMPNVGVNVYAYASGKKVATGYSPLGPKTVRDQYYLVSPVGRDGTIATATQRTDTTTAPSWNTNLGLTGSVGTGSEAPVNVQGGGSPGLTRNGQQRSTAQQQGTTETQPTVSLKSLKVEFRAGPPQFSSLTSTGYA